MSVPNPAKITLTPEEKAALEKAIRRSARMQDDQRNGRLPDISRRCGTCRHFSTEAPMIAGWCEWPGPAWLMRFRTGLQRPEDGADCATWEAKL